MATLTSIVNSAFRESGIVPVGGTPDTNETAEALAHLVNMISALVGSEAGNKLMDYDVGTQGITYPSLQYQQYSNVVISNSRLICNLNGATTLNLPAIPNDGDLLGAIDNLGNFGTYNLTLNGNGRQIEGLSTLVMNTNSDNREWFYREDLANWVKLAPLNGSSSSPFPSSYDEMLILMLCIRINPRYGVETAPETQVIYKGLMDDFRARYKPSQEMMSESALVRLPSYGPFYSLAYWNDFGRGR